MSKITLVDILKERKEERGKYFDNYLEYAKEIKKQTEAILGKCRVFVFGSVLKKDYHPILSDIDILVVSLAIAEKPRQKSKIKNQILSRFEFGNPFEIHLITPEEYEDWYSKFIDQKIEID